MAKEIRVQKKAREQTAMEQRNTAIVNFMLVALVPILLCIVLGFSLGKSESVNAAELHRELSALKEEKDQAMAKVAELRATFFKADTLLERFMSRQVRPLEDGIGKIEGPDSERAFNRWNRDREEIFTDFEYIMDDFERPADFGENENFKEVLEFGRTWILDQASIKNDELFTRYLKKKESVGMAINDDLEEKIQELQNELSEKNATITSFQIAMAQGNSSKDDNLQDALDAKMAAEQALQTIKGKNSTIKENINDELNDILENVVSELEARGVFSNRNEINDYKEKLKIKLERVKDYAFELTTE